jgi:hypothetical protein
MTGITDLITDVHCIAFDENGKFLATGIDGKLASDDAHIFDFSEF